MILARRFTSIVERSWKRCILTQKWLDHLLLMTSYLVTIGTGHHWTCLKKCTVDERTATENVRCWCFILSEKNSEKPYGGGGIHPTPLPPPYVLGLSPILLKNYTEAVFNKGAALRNWFGFVDGTVRPIPRPDENQRVVYNGHKRVHGLKFQSVVIPNGLIAHLYGPVGELLLCLSDWSSLFFFYFP